MNVTEQATNALQEVFTNSADTIQVIDERGDGKHFYIEIVSEKFAGHSRINRHKMVYQAIGDLMKQDHMHAVRLNLKTPAEC